MSPNPRQVRFKQVDVFSAVPFKGNPLAVVFDADDLGDDEMQAIARWTNLSETTFIRTPTDPRADYLVRIFTPAGELPFAGHPTLGTAHALIESGYRPREAGRIVQQCGVGLVDIEAREGGIRAFAAPPARIEALPASAHAALQAALRTDEIDFSDLPPCAVDIGPRWLTVRLSSADACLSLDYEPAALSRVVSDAGMTGLAVFAPHAPGGPATFEMRCIVARRGASPYEDPVTGSANAGLASLLAACGRRPGPRYTVRQGTALGRDGRVVVDYDDARARIWIGGAATTIIDGTVRLP
ncbi:MAG TPA: PhzF family phenazine biosynthesis protein [Trinickia sp.]|jgi:PhzF family phenazine biosynthesis protein|nr:PhzF family phenazine biosynthesis protein [Trinickia sp.]